MAEASSPNMASPFNALIASNQQPAPNPLLQVNQLAQTQGALAGAQKAQLEADDASLQNAQNHVNFRIQAMGPVVAKGDQVTTNDIAKGLRDLVESSKGAFSYQEAAHTLGQIPTAPGGDANAPNPAAATWLRNQQLRLLGMGQQISAMRGDTVSTNTGGGTQFGTRDSFTGAYRPQGAGGYVPSTMSPAQAATPTAGPVDKVTGTQTTETLGERAEQAGLAPGGTYTGRAGSSGPQQVYIDAQGGISKPRQVGGGAMMPPPAGGPIQTAPSPAQSEVLKAGGDQFAAAGQNAGTYGQQMTQLQSALTGLQNTGTGPGSESRQAIASYMLALPGGIGAYLPGVDAKSIQAYDEANKYLTQTAQGSPNATRSDAGLNTALASSPSVHISNAAAQDVLKANIGFRRAEMANYAAFQNSGADPGQYSSFVAQRNQQIDPRAYSVDLLSPAQRSTFMQSLSPAAKTKFLSSVRDAMSSGMIDTSALSGGGAGGR